MDRADQLKQAFTANHALLLKNLPADDIFLSLCYSEKLITSSEQELLLAEATNFRRVNKLLLTLHRHSVSDKTVFPRLLKVLEGYNKDEGGLVLKHVLSALEQSASRATSPFTYTSGVLNERTRALLLAKEAVMISSLDTEQVLPELVSRGVLSLEENNAISNPTLTSEERARRLVDILYTRGQEAFNKFVAVLQANGYQGLAMELTTSVTSEVDDKRFSELCHPLR